MCPWMQHHREQVISEHRIELYKFLERTILLVDLGAVYRLIKLND